MKILSAIVLSVLLVATAVSATTTTLDQADLEMSAVDTEVVEFCLFDANGQQNIDIVVDPICKDVDGLVGCQAGDDFAQTVFSVTPWAATINDGECVNLTLETQILDDSDFGKFYYTVNGQVGGTTIGSETGSVFVPEFGVLATAGMLAAAGIYMFRKRQ